MTQSPSSLSINLPGLVSDEHCFQFVRQTRWPEGVRCPHCHSAHTIKQGKDDTQVHRQRYRCKDCGARFDDLTGTIFAKRHQPLRIWILCFYLMGLNLSNQQIAKELELSRTSVHEMTKQLRQGIMEKQPEPELSEEVECDEVYITAGHKGNAEAVKKKGRKGRRNKLKGARGRGTLEKEKPPVLGMIQSDGQVLIRLLPNVQQKTIKPWIVKGIKEGTLIYTDEYNIYDQLEVWGYRHQTVCHGRGEYARDEDGDGFCEVHVNTIEGFWSLLRSWLRPHRGISQERLPLYLGFFQFVHNAKKRGKALLGALLETLLT